MEEFYSLQGEGYNTGQAAYFVRLGGCDVGCNWCDVKESWKEDIHKSTKADDIISNVLNCPAKAVVVTGGEPLRHNLDYFCKKLSENNIKLFLETSGSRNLSGKWDWICFSPKKHNNPPEEIYTNCDELKVIIFDENDFIWAEENAAKVKESCKLFLQPEWSNRNSSTKKIIDYILCNPKWNISIQTHKYLNIP